MDVDYGFLKISSSSFVIVGFKKPDEGQTCVPKTPCQNPAGKGKNRQRIKNKENHKKIRGMNLRETHTAHLTVLFM